MKDELKFEESMKRAYAVAELDDSAAARILAAATAPDSRVRIRRTWGSILAAGALTVASAAAYPVVDANLFCMSLVAKLHPPTAYSMTIQFLDANRRPMNGFNSMQVQYFQGNYALQDRTGWIYLSGPGNMSRKVDAGQRVALLEPGRTSDSFFRIPLEATNRLAGLDAQRKLTHLGRATENGHAVDRFRLQPDAKGEQIEISILADSGAPSTFRQYQYDKTGKVTGCMEMEFDYDSAKAQSTYGRLLNSFDREVDPSKAPQVFAEIGRKSRLSFNLGRDTLRVYRFEQLPSGAILLLYTLSGYHDGQQGCFVKLRDKTGAVWLPNFVDFSFAGKINGHIPVGQVFYPPVGTPQAPMELFVMHDEWEVINAGYFQRELEAPYRFKSLGMLQPTSSAQVPDWFYFHFGTHSWSTYQKYGAEEQLHDAISRKRYDDAVSVGEALKASIEDNFDLFFFDRCRLLVDLYFAHRGAGHRAIARSYLVQAIEAARKSPGQLSGFYRDLNRACEAEHMQTVKEY